MSKIKLTCIHLKPLAGATQTEPVFFLLFVNKPDAETEDYITSGFATVAPENFKTVQMQTDDAAPVLWQNEYFYTERNAPEPLLPYMQAHPEAYKLYCQKRDRILGKGSGK